VRILFISDVYFPRVNGVSTSLQTFKRGLESLGHEVFMLVPDYGDGGVDVPGIFRVAARGVLFDPEDRMMKRGGVLALEGTLKSLHIDVIHIHTPFVAHYVGVSMARRLRLPCVESYHTFFEEYLYHYVPLLPSAWLRSLARRFSRSQCNAVDAVVVPSTPMRDVLVGYGVKTNMVTLPTGL
jgi:1,2-diacylglycerol 3-alpha-glucosyltransferase